MAPRSTFSKPLEPERLDPQLPPRGSLQALTHPSLARPLQGSDQQLVALLCRNRRHPGSLRSSVDHETVAAVSKFKAQPLQTKEGKNKTKQKKTPTTNTTSGALVLSELDSAPPTSGPRRRFLRFPEARPKHCACACQGRGLADQGRKTGKAGAGSRTGVASGPPPLDHPTPR